ncbi:MAG TPA: SRPBCC family protein [Sphingobium sp.]
MRTGRWTILLGAVLAPACAQAAVKSATDAGFAVESSVDIAADAASVYALLGAPDRWWNGAHSYSGDAANLRLDPKAGGCFCETLPSAKGPGGSVEHARVIYAAPGRQLRLSGALGPLQAEAVTGTLNFDISKRPDGVRVTLTYVVGGYMRMGGAAIAPIVDKVLSEQLAGLKRAAERRGGQD